MSQRKTGRRGRSILDAQSLRVYLILSVYNTQANLITEFSNHYLAKSGNGLCHEEKPASSAFSFSNWLTLLIQWHFGAYTPIPERATDDFLVRETEARVHKIQHATAALQCAIYRQAGKIFAWIASLWSWCICLCLSSHHSSCVPSPPSNMNVSWLWLHLCNCFSFFL